MWHNLSERVRARPATAALTALLFALNAYICRELFGIEYTRHMGSIEAAFISLAHYISQHWTDLTWFPLWYGGIPFQNSYPPLLHATVAATANLTALSAAGAYHLVTAVLYCLAPVTLFWLALSLSGARSYSFFAGLLFTALSPSAWLVPQIRGDMGTPFGARRFETLVFYGEGPHLTGLVLLPVALLALHLVLEKRRWALLPVASAAMALTVLSNWLAAFALAIALAAYILARRDIVRSALWSAAAGALAYALAAPWVPPSTIHVIETNAKTIGGDYTGIYRALPLRAAAVAAGTLLLWWVGRRLGASLVVRFAAQFTWLTAVLVLPASWWGIALVPQPERYHLEMEAAICLLLPFLVRPALRRLPRRAQVAVAIVVCMLSVYPMKRERRFARFFLSGIDITSTVEYKVAKWFDANMAGGRVMAPGTISYWMNTWTGTPQLGGGFDQGISNGLIRMQHYVVYSDDGVAPGKELENSLVWLQAMGVQAVAAGGADSREVYKPYRHAEKYRALPELWREGGDAIWRVPSRSASLARVIRESDLPPRVPVNGIDLEPVLPYVAALNNDALPLATFHWSAANRAEAVSTLSPDQIFSLQISYHRGWRALVNGKPAPIHPDLLGQMYVAPNCNGECRLELTYDGGTEMYVARSLQGIGVLLSIGLAAGPLVRRRLRLRPAA